MGDVDEDGEGILCNRGVVFDQELEVLYGLELIALEKRQVRLRVSYEVLRSDLPYLRVSMVSM